MPTSPTSRRHRNSRRGFTLVELMVVLLLMVLVAGVATPSFITSHQQAILTSAGRQIVAACNYARSIAANRIIETRVYFDFDERVFYISVPDEQVDEETGQPIASDEPAEYVPLSTSLGRARAIPEGIDIEIQRAEDENPPDTGSDQVDYLSFTSDGRATDAQLVITDQHNRVRMVVIDDLTGRARLTEPDTTSERRR